MLALGCHLSAAKGFMHMAREAASIGANTFQFFTRNPRGGNAKPLDPQDAADFCAYARQAGIPVILAHAPYTLNACSADPAVREFARRTFADDLRRMEAVPGNLYNFHPGSHGGQGIEAGIRWIVEMLDEALEPGQRTTVLLETMAGKGSEVGGRLEELREILDRARLGDRLGVCLDTCHLNDAGYDLAGDLDGVLAQVDAILGLQRVKAIHLNDSKNPLGSRKDRHEKLGAGTLGLEALLRVASHPALRDKPFFLETPNELPGYAREIALIKERIA